METWDLDADLGEADWTKQAWDLPPYKSVEFFEHIGGVSELDGFRLLPVYEAAVAHGLIHDDEWVADYIN